jgi:hypothetical protein
MADNIKFDMTKLTDPQLEVAVKIIDACTAIGVNPDLVLPMAYVESRLNPDVPDSSKGAIGVMQLMPNTGKYLKVNPRNLDENIKGGCLFIRNLMENPRIAYDPVKVIAGYHDGPDSEYFKTGDTSKISDAALEYVDLVNQLSGGLIAPPAIGQSKENATKSEPAAASRVDPFDLSKPLPRPPPSESQYGFDPLAMAGGVLPGAAIGSGVGTGRTALDIGRRVGDVASQVSSNLLQASQGSPGQSTPGGLPPPGGPVQRTPVGGKMAFNYAKSAGMADFDAARALDMSKNPGGALDLKTAVAEAEKKIGPGYKMDPQRADLMLPENVGSGPRGQTRVPIPPVTEPSPTIGQRVTNAVAPVSRTLNHPLVRGPLGGLMAGPMGMEAASRLEKEDYPGAAIAGTGALAAGASMFGVPYSGGVAMAAPAVLAGADYARNTSPEQFQRDIKNYPGAVKAALPGLKKDIQNAPRAISAAVLDELKEWENNFKATAKRYQAGNIPVQPDALSGGLQ